MKSKFLIFGLFIAISKLSTAEAQIMDPLSPEILSNLTVINSSTLTSKIESKRMTGNTESIKRSNDNIDTTTKDNYKLDKEIEKTYYTVDSYVKNGFEMQNIYSYEKSILHNIGMLKNIISKLNYKESRNIISSSDLNDLYRKVGTYVDMANAITKDNYFRMTNADRINYLKNVETSLSSISSMVTSKLTSAKSVYSLQQANERQRNYFNSSANFQKQLRVKLNKKNR